MTTSSILRNFLLLSISFLSFSLLAQRDIPAQPETEKPVYDYADLLDQAEEDQLNNKLKNYADSTSTQIVIVTIERLMRFNGRSNGESVKKEKTMELLLWYQKMIAKLLYKMVMV